MANVNGPFGLRPWRDRSGRPYNGSASIYYVPATDATAIYVGDPVIMAGSADARGIPTVTQATAGSTNYLTGVMVGIVSGGTPVVPVTRDLPVYRPASTAQYILVADDPFLEYVIQEDSIGNNIAATDVGLNFNLVSGAGSTVTGQSGWMLDSSTGATGATLQARLLRMLDEEDNAIGTYAKWIVSVNLHSFLNTTGV